VVARDTVGMEHPPTRRSPGVSAARAVLLLVAVMWAIELVDALLPLTLDRLGITGRTATGLLGIPAAPLLHVGFGHLLANTVPFVVLGLLVAWRSRDRFWGVLGIIVLLGGLGVWLFTSPGTVTLGASGVLFGFAAYLVTAGLITRHWVDVVVAVGVVAVYGTMLTGVLPFAVPPGVSWLGHLTGAIAGVTAAMLLARRPAATPAPGG
jgi:membrane associated rhomboid family serine protease